MRGWIVLFCGSFGVECGNGGLAIVDEVVSSWVCFGGFAGLCFVDFSDVLESKKKGGCVAGAPAS